MMLDGKWNAITGHLKKCLPRSINMYCKEINKDDSICLNKHRLSLQSCNYGAGMYCATHYKKNLDTDHSPQLSRCANIRCDELNLSLQEREKIHSYNINKILGLPGDNIYNHVSKSQQKRFDWDPIPEVDLLEKDKSVSDFSTDESDIESEPDIDYIKTELESESESKFSEGSSSDSDEESESVHEPVLQKISINLVGHKRKYNGSNLRALKKPKYDR